MCGLVVTTEGDRVVGVRGDAEHPLSRGYTCPKGRASGEWHHHPHRLDAALVRVDGARTPVDDGVLLDDLAARLAAVVAESGPDAVAFYLATATSFDAAGGRAALALQRAMGTRSKYTALTIDTPCRPFVFDLVAGTPSLAPALDHDGTTCTLLLGTNPVVSHGHSHGMPDPVQRLRALASAPRELWVVDPRATATARLATRHLAIRPGTDWALLAHLVRELLGPDGGADRAYLADRAIGVEPLGEAVARWDRSTTADRCDLAEADLADLVASIRRHRHLAVQTGTGTTMSPAGVATEWLSIALQVVTGSYEAEGGVWFHPGFLRCFDRRTARPSAAEPAVEPGPASRPELPGRFGEYPCAALVDEIEAGNVRALVVVGGNPLTALPETDRLRAAFATLDVLAVADVVETETTAVATHVLPCTGQLERADVPDYVDQYQLVVASQHTAAVVPAGAGRRALWWWAAQLAARLGHRVLAAGLDPDTCTDDDVLASFADRGRVGYEELRAADGPIVAEGPVRGWVHEGVLPDGRWRLAPRPCLEALATAAADRTTTGDGLVLVPGRGLRTMNSALRDVAAPGGSTDAPAVHLHPLDAAACAVEAGAAVELRSAAGATTGRAVLDPSLRRGVVHVPHGWGAPHVGHLTSTRDGVDPLTGMVRQTGIPVTVTPA
jgi:anaerobic selenocysteine-containing dehydrogenase